MSHLPQVVTPGGTPSAPFASLPQDAPRPPCPSGFDPEVWERVVDIAVTASVKRGDDETERPQATPGWATTPSFQEQARLRNDEDATEGDTLSSTPQILKQTSDAALQKQNQDTLGAARAAVARCSNPDDDRDVDTSLLVQFALLREDCQPRDTRVVGDGFVDDTNTNGDSHLSRVKSQTEQNERDAALSALETVRDENALEVDRLCATHYEQFTAAVAQLEDVRAGVVQLGKESTAQNDALQLAGAPLLAARRVCQGKRNAATRLAKAGEVAEMCRHASQIACDAKHALDEGRWYDVLRHVDVLETRILPALAPRPAARSAFVDSDDEALVRGDGTNGGEGKEKTTHGYAVARALASSLLRDCARARDAAVRGADALAAEWLVAARAAAPAAGKQALSFGACTDVDSDAPTQNTQATRARAFAHAAVTHDRVSMRVLADESVLSARRAGQSAVAAAHRAAVDVAAAADAAKARRRAAELETVTDTSCSMDGVLLPPATHDTDTDSATEKQKPNTPLKRRIDFTAACESALKDEDVERASLKQESVSSSSTRPASSLALTGAPKTEPANPFHVLDTSQHFDVQIAPLRRAFRVFHAVGLGDAFTVRVREQRALQLTADCAFGETASPDDALRLLINVTFGKFVGHFAVEVSLTKEMPELFSKRALLETFHDACAALEKHLVAKLNGAAQAAVCRAVLDAVELACLALSRLGFEGAVGLLANVSTVIKQKVVRLMTEAAVESCVLSGAKELKERLGRSAPSVSTSGSGNSSATLLSRDSTTHGPGQTSAVGDKNSQPPCSKNTQPRRSANAFDVENAAQAFAVECGSFLGNTARLDEVTNNMGFVDVAARKTKACVTLLAETCFTPLAVGDDKKNVSLDEKTFAVLIADSAYLDSKVAAWCQLAGAAAEHAGRGMHAPSRETQPSFHARLAHAKGLAALKPVALTLSDTLDNTFAPFTETKLSATKGLLGLIKHRLEQETGTSSSTSKQEKEKEKEKETEWWFLPHTPTGPSEHASAAAAYIYGDVARALRVLPDSRTKFAVAFQTLLSLSNCVLISMERSECRCVNQNGLFQMEQDLVSFEHLADVLVDSVLTDDGNGGNGAAADVFAAGGITGDASFTNSPTPSSHTLKRKLRRAFTSLRAILALFTEPGDDELGDVDDFATNALTGGDGDGHDDENENDHVAPALAAARAQRILEKFKEAGAKKASPLGSVAFAGKKRVEAVAKALKAKAAGEK